MSRTAWLLVLGLMWLVVLVAASRVSIPNRLRPRRTGGAVLIDLDASSAVLPPVAGGVAERTGFGGWVDDLSADEPGDAPAGDPPMEAPAATDVPVDALDAPAGPDDRPPVADGHSDVADDPEERS